MTDETTEETATPEFTATPLGAALHGNNTGAVETASEPDKTSETAEEAKPEVKADAEKATEKTEEEAPKSEEADKKADEAKETVPLATLMEERSKRQALEKKLAGGDKETEVVSVFDDEKTALDNVKNEIRQENQQDKFKMSIAMVKQVHDDFDTVAAAFAEAVEENPSLGEQAANADNPALEVYNLGKKHMQLKEMGDLSTFKERMKEEILADIAKEKGEVKSEKDEKVVQLKESLPEDLANEQSSGVDKAVTGPTPLNKALKGNTS